MGFHFSRSGRRTMPSWRTTAPLLPCEYTSHHMFYCYLTLEFFSLVDDLMYKNKISVLLSLSCRITSQAAAGWDIFVDGKFLADLYQVLARSPGMSHRWPVREEHDTRPGTLSPSNRQQASGYSTNSTLSLKVSKYFMSWCHIANHLHWVYFTSPIQAVWYGRWKGLFLHIESIHPSSTFAQQMTLLRAYRFNTLRYTIFIRFFANDIFVSGSGIFKLVKKKFSCSRLQYVCTGLSTREACSTVVIGRMITVSESASPEMSPCCPGRDCSSRFRRLSCPLMLTPSRMQRRGARSP